MEWAAGSGLADGEIVGEVGGGLLFQNRRLERVAAEKRFAFDCRCVKSCRRLLRRLARHKNLADEIVGVVADIRKKDIDLRVLCFRKVDIRNVPHAHLADFLAFLERLRNLRADGVAQ